MARAKARQATVAEAAQAPAAPPGLSAEDAALLGDMALPPEPDPGPAPAPPDQAAPPAWFVVADGLPRLRVLAPTKDEAVVAYRRLLRVARTDLAFHVAPAEGAHA